MDLATFKYFSESVLPPMKSETLGDVLRKRREELALSLRDVEEKVGVSNAYLSQLENRKIVQPSPGVLRKISELYEISYGRLMELAGHPPVMEKGQRTVFFRTSNGFEEINKDEEKALLDYLRFLRMKRLKR
jgi:transcriptional regulator with XRE-family HTH domain